MHATFDVSPLKLNAIRLMAYQKHRKRSSALPSLENRSNPMSSKLSMMMIKNYLLL